MPAPCDTEIVDGPLLLRPWQPDDARALEAAVVESIDSLGRWLPWCRAGYDLAAAQDWVRRCEQGWAEGEHFAFGIFDRTHQRLLGSVGLNQRNLLHRSANLGYWVRQSEQRHGVAAKAVQLVARFGFRQLALQRIEIVALPDNQASRRTAERAGARFEAVARRRIWDGEQARDGAVYALVPEDLEQA
ncbi:GNAT family N-acetyltransferase [Dyella ginsengisoli]|uniref:GNAT family N-acetyltransferase n=1 Tax=Dyella ginsengisoli TaxID=363848 RepID=UPI00034A1C52|nr:GNAT family protein [Dyella ginsengisoli]